MYSRTANSLERLQYPPLEQYYTEMLDRVPIGRDSVRRHMVSRRQPVQCQKSHGLRTHQSCDCCALPSSIGSESLPLQ